MEPLLTQQDVAKFFATTVATLANWCSSGIGPEYIKIGSSFRYTRAAIEAYVTSQTKNRLFRKRLTVLINRNGTYHYKFQIDGKLYRGTTKQTSLNKARQFENVL